MTDTDNKIGSLKSMINSCYTYGGAERSSHNFNRYIKSYMDEVGYPKADEVYEAHMEDLRSNFEVKFNVATDSEGCTYNSLTKKQ